MERKENAGEEVSQKPVDKIADFLEVIKKTHTGHRDDPRVLERIKEYYHKEHVINKKDIPESYFENQKRLARERGHGDIEITDEIKNHLSEVIVSDQESTLDNWVEYLSSPDADSYPMWAKYWAFNGIIKLSTFDKEKHAFAKRDKSTVAPFPDLNREALAYAIDAVIKKAGKEKVPAADDNPELKKIIEGANFGKLYAYAIEKVTPTEENELLNIKGEWITYPQNSDHMPLVKSLQGYGTGWCTAGESTAQAQLKNGDFHVYYSYDKQGQPTIPRIAIRMEENKIAEVRGIAPEQNLDPYIGSVVDKKLAEFPDGGAYQKKSSDMKQLTEIDKRNSRGEKLTTGDLRFLYQVDSKIEGFGYQKDPRIQELLAERDIKSDISLATGFSKDQISMTEKEALSGGIKFHYGNLSFEIMNPLADLVAYHKSLEEASLPEIVGGNFHIGDLESVKGLKLPEKIIGYLNFSNLRSADGLVFPKIVGGSIFLRQLKSAEGLKLPETVNDGLDLSNLQSAKGLKLPDTVGGNLDLGGLQSAKGLKLPDTVGGKLNLEGLKSAEGLQLPETVGSSLNLGGLQSADGLKLPETMGGDLYLEGLKSTDGLKLPETVGGKVDLSGLPTKEKEKMQNKYPNLKIIN